MIDIIKYFGKKWDTGFNCWDFVCLIYQTEFKVRLCRYAINYAGDLRGACAAVEIEKGDPVWTKANKPEAGCVILMGRKWSGWHAGVMVNERQVIHLMDNAGVIVQDLADLQRKFAIIEFYRHARIYPYKEPAETTDGL